MESEAEKVITRTRRQIRLLILQAGKVARQGRSIERYSDRDYSPGARYYNNEVKQLAHSINQLTARLGVLDRDVLEKAERVIKELNHLN